VDSSKFAQPAGHQNPGAFPFQRERFNSPVVRVGGFKLGPKLVESISGVEGFAPDLHGLPANMAASFQIYDDALVTSTDPSRPRVGDLRVSWMEIAPKTLTVLARVQGGELVEAPDASGRSLGQVQIGERSLSDVVPGAAPRPRFAWVRRVLALLLAFVPLALLAAAFWLGVRNITALVLVVFAALAAFGAFLRWKSVAPPDDPSDKATPS